MDVEQRNCYFCICDLNRLLIFTFVRKQSSDRNRAGGQSQPRLYLTTHGKTQGNKLLRFTVFHPKISEVRQRNEGCLAIPDSSNFF